MRRLLLLLTLFVAAAAMADGPAAPYLGRKVVEVIDAFRESGEPFAYSTNVVTDDLRVIAEPEVGTPLQVVRQILRPHGLTIQEEAGVLLVVRAEPVADSPDNAAMKAPSASTPGHRNCGRRCESL